MRSPCSAVLAAATACVLVCLMLVQAPLPVAAELMRVPGAPMVIPASAVGANAPAALRRLLQQEPACLDPLPIVCTGYCCAVGFKCGETNPYCGNRTCCMDVSEGGVTVKNPPPNSAGFELGDGTNSSSSTGTIGLGDGEENRCFAADSLVTHIADDGSAVHVPLSSVRAGDRVLSVDSAGRAAFEPVVYLAHALNNRERATMRRIEYDAASDLSSAALTASHDHMLFVQKAGADGVPELNLLSGGLVEVGDVRVGDRVAVTHCAEGDEATIGVCTTPVPSWRAVTAVSDVSVTGLQNAWTASGRIVVSDVLASPFRASTLASYRALLKSTAAVLQPLGVSEAAAHQTAHSVYASYLQWFRQTKPHALSGTNDLLYAAGLLLAAAGAVKAARKVAA